MIRLFWKILPGALPLALFAAAAFCCAQTQLTSSSTTPPGSAKQNLRIASGDELEITIFGASDLSAHGRVDTDGNIFIPLLGSVHVAGMTSSEAAQAITARLQQNNVMTHPQVAVFVKEYTSGQISVAGEVNKPGVYSAMGAHRLLDILQDAGGLTDKAGNPITISHRGTNDITTVDFQNDPAAMARNNMELQPGDTVIVPKAGIVYVLGQVNKPGGYISTTAGGFTVLQIMAAAGGPTYLASEDKTTMMRRDPGGLMRNTTIPLGKMLRGKMGDMSVQPDDILYVPLSGAKAVFSPVTIFSLASQAAIYRIP